ncbi:hypothetical protein WQ54_06260 [Bacillus sp. SA1-12]|uniref:DUF3907 family protein n=1 Tax=Bacillus sp. SA1-12 TaxID=1455638 RepID=UPI000625999E|nr:DUF3907 family protein [Bacillus sp. SA1-12]KKI93105.1 hypothetical protein WQ54_06260 [Bacillus sp. SA1-12]
MEGTGIKSELKHVITFLENVVGKMTNYLNEITLSSLEAEIEGDIDYFKELLKTVRKLVVFCEEALEACLMAIRNQSLKEVSTKQLLYKVYHQCIERYFQPKNDVWFEDSRSSYTGTNTIIFRKTPPPSLAGIIISLENDFLAIREELDFGIQV